ncbi:Major facilitator superfamily domain-containing protein 8 [Balamuthia mandrillaris]
MAGLQEGEEGEKQCLGECDDIREGEVSFEHSQATEGEQRYTRWNVYLCYAVAFLGSVSFSIVIPSLWPYLKAMKVAKAMLGYAVASYSLGQMIGGPCLGLWAKWRGTKEVLCASLMLSIVGYVVYALVEAFSLDAGPSLWLVVSCRFIIGFAAGNNGLVTATISRISSSDSRTNYLANLEFIVSFSYIAGPAFGVVLSFVDFDIVGKLKVTAYTAPAYLSVLATLLSFFFVLFFYQPLSSSTSSIFHSNNEDEESKAERISLLHSVNSPQTNNKQAKNFRRLLCLLTLALCYFFLFNCLAVYETMATPLTIDEYGWNVKWNAVFWACIGVVSAGGVLMLKGWTMMQSSIGIVAAFVNDYTTLMVVILWLAISFLPMIGFTVFPVALWRFCVGSAMIAFGFPAAVTEMVSIYSKVVGDHSSQEVMMGWLTASGATARLLGPIWASNLYAHLSQGADFVFVFPLAEEEEEE